MKVSVLTHSLSFVQLKQQRQQHSKPFSDFLYNQSLPMLGEDRKYVFQPAAVDKYLPHVSQLEILLVSVATGKAKALEVRESLREL